MDDEDLGFCKFRVSPDETVVALKLDSRALEILEQLISCSKPRPTDAKHKFEYHKGTVLGALGAARSQITPREQP